MKKNLLLLFTLFSTAVFAQDDLLKQLESQSKPVREPVIATFKSTKIINIQTNETNKKRNLDFRVSHLFGNVGEASGGGYHNFYGFDQSNDIRIAFNYGITDRLMVGVARAKRNEALEGTAKFKALEQTTDNKMPLSVSIFGESAFTTVANTQGYYDQTIHRLSYCGEVIIARKFSPRFSFEIVPTWIHRNIVNVGDTNDLILLGGGVRWKFTKSSAIVADYFYTISPTNRAMPGVTYQDPLGAGVEIETGGHVFTIMFTNAIGLLETDFLANTVDSWSAGGFKFSFNISRTFKLGKANTEK